MTYHFQLHPMPEPQLLKPANLFGLAKDLANFGGLARGQRAKWDDFLHGRKFQVGWHGGWFRGQQATAGHDIDTDYQYLLAIVSYPQ